VNSGVLSIYQSGNSQGQGISSGFTLFYAGFLEKRIKQVAD
jgi:hypothetical protein